MTNEVFWLWKKMFWGGPLCNFSNFFIDQTIIEVQDFKPVIPKEVLSIYHTTRWHQSGNRRT